VREVRTDTYQPGLFGDEGLTNGMLSDRWLPGPAGMNRPQSTVIHE
jgi:hypothetical protein